MLTVFTVVHVVVCLLMIALVLLQDPKSGGAGGMFGGGGGSNSLLGATGAATFLTRLTRFAAIAFGITCIALSLFAKPNVGSVLDSVPAQSAPVNGVAVPPEGVPAAQNATGNPAMQDPKQAGTEAAPAQGSNPQRVKADEPSTAPAAK
ncbi:MAG: preprotein translocase subunit SecG [Bdellovibrionota bacterium]